MLACSNCIRRTKMSKSGENSSILVWRTMKDVWKLWYRQAERNLSLVGLNNMEYNVLRILSENNAISMVQLANLSMVTQGWITSMVDKLEERKLLERSRSTDDRRIIMIQITNAGKRLMSRAQQAHVKFLEESIKGLNETEISDLLGLLEKLKASLVERPEKTEELSQSH
ncbi:MAG: hypothetical protein B2I17_03725 [Thermoplasmatales archaeon B_DKE]|nr:MAG: hypothetical protein B2I17_03725 [Thermoplasmatales archaeon B_DKE]